MNKTLLAAAVGALFVVGGAPVASANDRGHGINDRQHHQQQRIGQGVRSGELTRGEARHLEREQRHMRMEERRYRADGGMNRGERQDLHHDLNAASKNIYQQKHDAEKR